MADNPSITIIVPSLNQGRYLDQCLDSIVSQQYPKLQLLVVDGGSTDNSVDTIKKYQKHIDWWVSEPDSGQSEAINKGLARAKGEVINWLNSDDYYEPGALHIVGEAFRDPAVRVLCGRSRIFDENGTIRFSRGTDIYEGNLAKTIGMARIDQPETFFRKVAWEGVGLLNPNLHFVMDREWWIRYLFRHGLEGILKTEKVLVNFRYHAYSKTVKSQSGFDLESIGLYKNLAKSAGFAEELKNLGGFLDVTESGMDPAYRYMDIELAKASMHHHLLQLAHQYYARDNHSKAGILLDLIDSVHFSPDDRALYRKLSFRNRLPSWLIHLFRKSNRS